MLTPPDAAEIGSSRGDRDGSPLIGSNRRVSAEPIRVHTAFSVKSGITLKGNIYHKYP